MRAVFLFLAFCAAIVPLPVRCDDLVTAYAHAVRAFNPQLDESAAQRLARATLAEADRQHLDARLLVALIAVESRWHPSAVSAAGALGLAQLMPATAGGLGVDPSDPEQNIAGAARHLRALLEHYAWLDRTGQYVDAIAAYNAGAGAVDRYGGVPPYVETQRYVRDVIRLWRQLAGA